MAASTANSQPDSFRRDIQLRPAKNRRAVCLGYDLPALQKHENHESTARLLLLLLPQVLKTKRNLQIADGT
jgi:hypothetical protein